ncbi:MAG: hypothetical protein LQ345_006829 [Seirophora villosa]|nr:MAG: hypothetical protein LQ345_006829 [Seirophora villosa]
MKFLGGVMLHEYTHGEHIRDWAYGPVDVRNLRSNKETVKYPVFNADSYAWFALEVYWSKVCGKTFAAPLPPPHPSSGG